LARRTGACVSRGFVQSTGATNFLRPCNIEER
jgi:hypothetical protein